MILKQPLISSVRQTKERKELSISQSQAIIKLIEKRTQIKAIFISSVRQTKEREELSISQRLTIIK